VSSDEKVLTPRASELVVASQGLELPKLPTGLQGRCSGASLLGVDYIHFKTNDGGELYLTHFGLPFWQNLLPENWYAPEWFEAKRERLEGTSVVYKVPTRMVEGRMLNLVVKWSRVGEQVPLDTLTVNKFIHAEFNSPFEEFSLLMEVRKGDTGPQSIRIRTQQPLAIYVPSGRLQLWQTGRSEEKLRVKIARHPGVEIDILRQYVLLYGWIKGLDAVEMTDQLGIKDPVRSEFLARVTNLVAHELSQKGYRVIDMKPAHAILRLNQKGALLRDRNDQIVYALVDYELLERTPEHEHAVRNFNRKFYLKRMARRFESDGSAPMPVYLRATNIMGVDYIFGRAESTGGLLWVVGKDPDLSTFFLPERWRRTPKKNLSSRNQVFFTCTKDNINLVWRVSRMGDPPYLNNPEAHKEQAKQYGFNSPFEEFAFALQLSRSGVKTIYPRAIYMTGSQGKPVRAGVDERRYSTLANLVTPDGEPAVRKDYDYIVIWGYWNGPDELLAAEDDRAYTSINAKRACANGLISQQVMEELVQAKADKLLRCGLQDLNLKPDHLLISFDSQQKLVLDNSGKPEVRLCNFELVRPRT
jgi:hypothetical protein